MARTKDKEKAIALRKKGMSYSQIKSKLGVSKSTLSGWLKDMPLSQERINELRANSARRIELFRETMLEKRNTRLSEVRDIVSKDIGIPTDREFFVAGFFLYWAEGGKTTKYTISLSNTDPNMIRAYLKWLQMLKVSRKKVIVRLHLYADMNVQGEMKYWQKEIKLPKENFRKPYVKRSKQSDLTYVTKGHGTCNVIVNGRDIAEYVHQGLKHIADVYSGPRART